MRERVVVTGLGVLTPIGSGVEEFRQGLREGRDGVGPVTGFPAGRHRVQVAAELRDFHPERHLGPEELARSSRAT